MIFNDKTRWFIYFGTFLLLIGIPIFFLAFYLLWFKSSKKTPLEYKLFYSLLILSALIMHICILVFMPFLLPPFKIAFTMIGILSNLGYSANFQMSLCYFAFGSLCGADTYLLYYRIFAMLPPDHKLKKRSFLYSYYVFLFCLLVILTVLIFIAGEHEHHNSIQRLHQENFIDPSFNLSDSAIGIYEVSISNIYLILVSSAFIISALTAFFLFPFVIYFAFNLLKQLKGRMSKRTLELHTNLLTAIAAQVAVIGMMGSVTTVIIFGLYFIGYTPIEGVNAVLLGGVGPIPILCIVAMILGNRRNRRELLRLLRIDRTEQVQERKEREYSIFNTAKHTNKTTPTPT